MPLLKEEEEVVVGEQGRLVLKARFLMLQEYYLEAMEELELDPSYLR